MAAWTYYTTKTKSVLILQIYKNLIQRQYLRTWTREEIASIPLNCSRSEVFRALNKTRGLYLRWQELSTSPILPNTAEVEWTSIELRNALRSIEWDLEDLEDTIGIAEKNSSKFKIDHKEICDRRSFIQATKQEVQVMKVKMSMDRNLDSDGTQREPLLNDGSPVPFRSMQWSSTPKISRYSKLASQTDSPSKFEDFENVPTTQDHLISIQDEELSMINDSVSSLKSISTHIGNELDEHAVMLEDLSSEMDITDSQMYTTILHVSKALHLDTDRGQWAFIVFLMMLLLIGIIVAIVL
ncbi:unnamed protein product [Leptosia nina]|uniref:t-SNARE coiled-coil homology domain-containing protein n=1 Tax=Leptosia nina TaxID=320188 RepID=A0AAV1JXF1_9NEOP